MLTASQPRSEAGLISQDALLEAFALMSDGISVSDERGLICYTNASLDRLFGYGPGELVGHHVSAQNAYAGGENDPIVGAVFRELAARGSWSGEWLNRRKDGSTFITSANIRAIEWDGRRHWLCVQQDVSKSLSNNGSGESERLAIAAEAAELGIWEWDIPGNTFVYSARARMICGFPSTGDISYEDVQRVTHPEDFPHTSAQAKRALDPLIRDRTPFEYRVIRSDGALRWVRAHGYAVFAEVDGVAHALRYIGTLEDITDRVAVRKRQEEAARQVGLALEAARMAVWSLDLAAGTLKPSREFNQLFGLEAEAVPTLDDVEARCAPGELDGLRMKWSEAIDLCATTFDAEFTISREDAMRRLHVRCDIAYSGERRPERAFGIVMDITDKWRADNSLRESDARFREAADSAPSPVWMTDSNGKVEFGNRAMAEFAGLGRDEVMGDRWLSLIHPDDVRAVVEERNRAWSGGHLPYTVEARFQRADGAWRWLEVNSRPRRGADDSFRGYVGLAVDRTDARTALATLVESEQRFRLLADSAPVMIWMSDPAGACLYLNAALRAFWKIEAGDLQSFDWRVTMHPDDEAQITAELVRATMSAKPFTTQGRYRNSDGAYRIVQTRGEPRFSQSGEFLGMIGVNVDMTDVVEAQERQRLLMDELNHRVKNTLAVVQGLAKQTFKPDSDPAQASGAFDARLRALAGAHTLLTESNWEGARLSGVVDLAVMVCANARERIEISGPDLNLTPKHALSLALALHELCTNAVKHGALSTERGRVALHWRVDQDERLFLEWRESGGSAVVRPMRKSFGSALLERVVPRDVNGKAALDFEPDGVRYQLSFSLADAS